MKTKKQNRTGIPIQIYIDRDMKNEVDRIAKKRKISSSAVYRIMFDLGISCHQDMEKVGIIAAVDFAHFVRKALKDKMENKELKQLRLF
jgi:hypothetical protein